MAIVYQRSTSNILTFKLVLISSSVLSAAIMLSVTDVGNYVPSIYNGIVSWLRPPYLYLVINCIIITIVASSKLQSTKDEASPLDAMGIVPPQPVKSTQDSSSYQVKVEKGLEFDAYTTRNEDFPVIGGEEDATSNKENEYVMAKSAPESNGCFPSNVKPPVSARFSHRKNVKASPEGGRTVLGVSKAKKQETLESTWKTITEGRPIPISRHLRKSETWERDAHPEKKKKTMKKSETFNERPSANSPLRKEASLSQDELNRRVEAFIKKFNEEMRLQRQDSLNQYMEIINRGSH